MKCIDVKSNAFRIPLIIWIVAVLVLLAVHPVKAESGTVSITTTQAGSRNAGGDNGKNFDFSKIIVDTNDYNTFQVLKINSTDFTGLSRSVDFTTFTISSGGIGTGTVAYTTHGAYIEISWFFDDGDTFGGSPTSNVHEVGLTYANTSFFGNAANVNNHKNCVAGYLDSTFPISAMCGDGTPLVGSSSGTLFNWIGVGTTVSANYSVSYLSNNRFSVNFTKSNGVTNTQGLFYNSSGFIYFSDALGKANFDFIDTYSTGLYLNFTTVNAYKIYIINSTGFTPTPTPTPAPGGQFNPALPVPSSGGSIQFNQTKYVVGDTVRVEWAISNADWNGIGQTFIINFYQNDVAFLTDAFPTGQIPISSQTGNYSFIVNQPSVIRADLDGGFLFATNVLGSAYTTIVPATPAFISVPATAQQGQNVTINYGFAAGSTVNTGFIKDVVLDDFGQPILTTLTYTNLSCPCGTSGTISKIFGSTGKHRLTLFDATALKTVATADIQISASGVAPGLNITSNSLTLDNAVYNYNDVIIGSYQISTANYSLYPYFRISLISNSGIFGNSIDVPSSQTGTFQLPVNSGMFQTLQSGAAFVNLTAQSSAFNNTLVLMAYVPVTINANFNGYSVSANPQTICKNQPVYVKYTGQTGTGTLKTTWVTLAGTTKTNSFNFSANGTKVFSFADGTIMDKSAVQFDIYDLAGNFQVGSIVKYQSTGCTQAGTTTTATATPGQVQSGGSAWNSANINLLSLIAMPAFYGLLILIGSIIACSRNEKAASSTGIVAFIVANVEAVIGLWAPFTLYILVVTWVLLGIYFTVGRKTTTQN